MLQNYNLGQRERVLVRKNWLCRKGLQFIVTLTKEEQDVCNDEMGLFETLRKTFKPQFSETIKLLQFHKLAHCFNGCVEEWMAMLKTAVVACKYKAVHRLLKEQFIHALNDDKMLAEVIRELRKCMEDVTIPSKTVLACTKK